MTCSPGQLKDPKTGECKPDLTQNCPAGKHHNGKKCVDGDPPECSTGYEHIAGSCVKRCPKGLKRVGNTAKCENNDEDECPDGEIKDPKKGCVSNTPSALSGILSGLGASLSEQANAGLFGSLSSAAQALLAEQLRRITGSYGAITTNMISLEGNIRRKSFEMKVPSDAERDALIHTELQKPIMRKRNTFKIWG